MLFNTPEEYSREILLEYNTKINGNAVLQEKTRLIEEMEQELQAAKVEVQNYKNSLNGSSSRLALLLAEFTALLTGQPNNNPPVSPPPPPIIVNPPTGSKGFISSNGYTFKSDGTPGLIRPLDRSQPLKVWNNNAEWHWVTNYKQGDGNHVVENNTNNADGSISYWSDLGAKTCCSLKDNFLQKNSKKSAKYVAVTKLPDRRYSGLVNAPLWVYSENDPVFGKAEIDYEIVAAGLQVNFHYPTKAGGKSQGSYLTTDKIFDSYNNNVQFTIDMKSNGNIHLHVVDLDRNNEVIIDELITPDNLRLKFPDMDVDKWLQVKFFPYWAYMFLSNSRGWAGLLEASGKPTNTLQYIGVFETD